MTLSLRPYQAAALQVSRSKFLAGQTRQLIALPTGTGKTPTFAALKEAFGFDKKVMVLVHREELADQAADKIRKWNPGAFVGVEMGDRWATPMDEFVVASVPTLGRKGSKRLARFNPNDFSAIVVDEAHHSIADSYLNIFNHFGLLEVGCPRLLLGVTATPNRGDGVALGQVFDEIVYQMTIKDAIREGWLVDIRGVRVRSTTSLDAVRTQAGDFQQGDLSNATNTPERNDLIVRKWVENASTRSTLVFCVDIKHAQDLAQSFRRNGIEAEAVWGDDPDRAGKLARHRAGQIKVLCNCAVLTEGYDDPNIGCIVMARPTKSNLLFVQMAGRGTRLQANIQNLHDARTASIEITKPDCLLMDVVDNTSRHSLITLNSIFGLSQGTDLKGQPIFEVTKKIEEAQKAHPELDFSKLEDITKLDSFVEQVNLFEVKYPEAVMTNSLLQWHQNTEKDSFVLLLPDKEDVVITPDLLGKFHVVGTVNGTKLHDTSESLPGAFKLADSFVTTYGKEKVHLLKRKASWHGDPATPKQLALLRRLGIDFPMGLSKGDAAKKTNQFFANRGQFWANRKKAA